jgi:hypothetical protein
MWVKERLDSVLVGDKDRKPRDYDIASGNAEVSCIVSVVNS